MKKATLTLLMLVAFSYLVFAKKEDMSKLIDLTGKVYGRLTVISYSNAGRWSCVCECGNTKIIRGQYLKDSRATSCGCFHSEQISKLFKRHGEAHKSKEYRTWRYIKSRCYNKNNNRYYSHGARGITVCDMWLASYTNFLTDMGRAPSVKHTIEREDNNGNYEPGNCKWATPKEQANNKTTNKLIEFNGEIKTLSQWAGQLAIPYHTIKWRLYHGWSVDRAFQTPLKTEQTKP